ncbi:hypothetical protein Esti_002613 [Eimeria stiedai]
MQQQGETETDSHTKRQAAQSPPSHRSPPQIRYLGAHVEELDRQGEASKRRSNEALRDEERVLARLSRFQQRIKDREPPQKLLPATQHAPQLDSAKTLDAEAPAPPRLSSLRGGPQGATCLYVTVSCPIARLELDELKGSSKPSSPLGCGAQRKPRR